MRSENFLLLAFTLLLAISPGCRTRKRAADLDPTGHQQLDIADLDYDPLEYAPRRETHPLVYAKQINDTLIYPVQSGRAEDYAETLRPILEARFGSGVVIIPHEPTNQLIIKIPPYDPENLQRGGARSPTRGQRNDSRAAR